MPHALCHPCRHTYLPLVCRRLHSLLYSPRLLRHVSIVVTPSSSQEVQSLLSWLAARCTGRMQHLDLHIGLDYLEEEEASTCAEIGAQLAPFLAACGAAGGLETLAIDVESEIRLSPLLIGGWAAAFRGLKHLTLSWSGELQITSPLRCLESLQSLRLQGAPLRLPAGAALPPSLAALSIGGNVAQPEGALPMPPQVGCTLAWLGLHVLAGVHGSLCVCSAL